MAKATMFYLNYKKHSSHWSQQEVIKITPVTEIIKDEIRLKMMK